MGEKITQIYQKEQREDSLAAGGDGGSRGSVVNQQRAASVLPVLAKILGAARDGGDA
jgi:hypothetical protein